MHSSTHEELSRLRNQVRELELRLAWASHTDAADASGFLESSEIALGSTKCGNCLTAVQIASYPCLLQWLDIPDVVNLTSADRKQRAACNSQSRRLIVPTCYVPNSDENSNSQLQSEYMRLFMRVDPSEIVNLVLETRDWRTMNSWLGWIAAGLGCNNCKCKSLKVMSQLEEDLVVLDWDASPPCDSLVDEPIVYILFGALQNNRSIEVLEIINLQGWLWWLTDDMCQLIKKSLSKMCKLKTLKLDVSVLSEDGFIAICDGIATSPSLRHVKLKGPAAGAVTLHSKSCRAIASMVQAASLEKLSLFALPGLGAHMLIRGFNAFQAFRSLTHLSLKIVGLIDAAILALPEAVQTGSIQTLSLKVENRPAMDTWADFFTSLSRGPHALRCLKLPWLLEHDSSSADVTTVMVMLSKFLTNVPVSFKRLKVMYPSFDRIRVHCRSLQGAATRSRFLEDIQSHGWYIHSLIGFEWVAFRGP